LDAKTIEVADTVKLFYERLNCSVAAASRVEALFQIFSKLQNPEKQVVELRALVNEVEEYARMYPLKVVPAAMKTVQTAKERLEFLAKKVSTHSFAVFHLQIFRNLST